MDLTQNKLSRAEWDFLEIPVSQEEKKILEMIIGGYGDNNIRINETQSLFSFIKIDKTEDIELFLYKTYFEEIIVKFISKYGKNTPLYQHILELQKIKTGKIKIKKNDTIRIQNLGENIKINQQFIFEYLLIDLLDKLIYKLYKNDKQYSFYLYTIIQLKKTCIRNINKYIIDIIDIIITYTKNLIQINEIIENAYEFIESNKYLLKYEDKQLFSHQQQIFNIYKNDMIKMMAEKEEYEKEREQNRWEDDDDDDEYEVNNYSKLILYTAPTGTGKTLTPIGLSEDYRIIFVCVARHIGMALAKSAISVDKKVAFAFGCETASDIRLHYYSAIDYSKNTKTGGIWKVDNSNGKNVEIIVCDVKSYITAMHYMLAFNDKSKIITYMDEPTITLDYETHPLHSIIHNNWKNNLIPNVILSCATLPTIEEIHPIFDDFRNKFDNATLHSITSYDCKKSIPIISKSGMCVLPHYMYDTYSKLYKCVEYCNMNKTLLRYFDLREILQFIKYINDNNLIDDVYSINNYYSDNINNITMDSLKEYYLLLLANIEPDNWKHIYENMIQKRKNKFYNSSIRTSIGKEKPPSEGVLITTVDSHTITDGPTIYLVDDVNKIGTFYIQQSKIDPNIFNQLMEKITHNNKITDKIDKYEREISAKEDKIDNETDKMTKQSMNNDRVSKTSQIMLDEITKLRRKIFSITLNPEYLPNTIQHQKKWIVSGKIYENAFIAQVDEETCKTIMLLKVDDKYKLLLLLGIGMFAEINNPKYMEIMKSLAEQQKLFMIIASTDYIYGTNYQFCHGFIGKDLTNITQQKTLQSMGRIGRNNIQQDYTIRFRDDNMIYALFQKPEYNIEAVNMCKLYVSDDL